MKMMEFLYGYYYHIYPFYVSTDDVGHSGCRRDRVYIILAHKTKVKKLVDPYVIYNKIRKTIRSNVYTEPSDYLIAPRDEIQLDAADVARIRKKRMTVAYASTMYLFAICFLCSKKI